MHSLSKIVCLLIFTGNVQIEKEKKLRFLNTNYESNIDQTLRSPPHTHTGAHIRMHTHTLYGRYYFQTGKDSLITITQLKSMQYI